MAKKHNVKARVISPRQQLIAKAEVPTQTTPEEEYIANDWIEPPADLIGYQSLVDGSAILPQCIRAYKNNIAGFGIGVRYIDDEAETPERKAEFEKMVEIIDCLTLEDDTKEIFEDWIEARETFGIGYVEVIRNNDGEVVQLEFVRDTASVRKTKPLDYQDMTYYHHGETLVRKKRFRKYLQRVGGKTIYFKEFGDTRLMDNRTGEYVPQDTELDMIYQANEILELALGTKPYGTVRWAGQILGVDGARKAEKLNHGYFENGRHTPLAIIVQGGTLSDESFEKLQHYMDEIKGENGQHSFLLLETESSADTAAFEGENKPSVVIKDLANILQKDELFSEYIDNKRKAVQSAFQLPDLYTAYTTDFNRATAQTAQEVTEEQVFQPERVSLAWVLNNKILNQYQFKYVEAYFKAPNITNPDDLHKIMTVANSAGGLTPNKAKDILYKFLGEESENYEGEWGDEPLARSRTAQGTPIADMTAGVEKSIAKAKLNHEDEIVSVLKEVKHQLIEMGGGEDGQT